MSSHFPPTPAEIIGIVLVLVFWVIELILDIINDEGPRIVLAVLGLGATGVVLLARLKAAEQHVPA